MREWSIIPSNHPSNPQQPIHSLRLAPVSFTRQEPNNHHLGFCERLWHHFPNEQSTLGEASSVHLAKRAFRGCAYCWKGTILGKFEFQLILHNKFSDKKPFLWPSIALLQISHPRHCKSFSFVASGMLGKDGLQSDPGRWWIQEVD
jgi:hypothetical protein